MDELRFQKVLGQLCRMERMVKDLQNIKSEIDLAALESTDDLTPIQKEQVDAVMARIEFLTQELP